MKRRIAALIAVCLVIAAGSARAQTMAPVRAAVPGDDLFAATDFGGAERAYRRVLQGDAHSAGAELGLARISLYHNDLGEAERHARALAADDPRDPRAGGILKAIAERRDDGASYRISMPSDEVVVPFRLDPLPRVDAIVNGKPARLLLDTGAPGLDLTPAFAAAAGITAQRGGEAIFAGGKHGFFHVGRVKRLDLGEASIRSIPITITEQPPTSPGSSNGVDGVIGTKLLYHFLSTIDYVNHRLILRRKSASKAFEAAAKVRGAVVVPMLLVPDHMIFARAHVNDAPEALYNVDTGGPGIGVDLSKEELAAARVVPDAAHPATFVGGGGPTQMLPFVANVTFGGRTIRRVPGVFMPEGDVRAMFPFRVAGTISQEAFKNGALTFDFSTMRLVYEAPQR